MEGKIMRVVQQGEAFAVQSQKSETGQVKKCNILLQERKRVRDASIYASKKISLKFLFLSDIFLFPPIRQQVPILA